MKRVMNLTTSDVLDFLAEYGEMAAPGRIVSTRLLRRQGTPDEALRSLTHDGTLVRIRPGWYRFGSSHPDALSAVAAGGVLTCLSALEYHGVWTPAHHEIHARTSQDLTLRGPRIRCCSPSRHLAAPVLAVDPPLLAVRAAAGCATQHEFVAILDSVIERHLADREDLASALAGAPGGAARQLREVAWAQSGSESIARLNIQDMGLKVRSQVWIDGVGRVDLLVGDRLVVEVDSWAFHASPDHYRADRTRDLALISQGYRVIRVTYEQVLYNWPSVRAAIEAVVACGGHVW